MTDPKILDKAIDGSDFSLATVLNDLYKDHLTDDMERGTYKSLSMFLSTILFQKLIERSNFWMREAHKATKHDQIESCNDKSFKLLKVLERLRNHHAKDQIIKEYNVLYHS